MEINEGRVASRREAVHFDEGSSSSITTHVRWKCPKFNSRKWRIQFLQRYLKDGLVEPPGANHVLNVDFKPGDGIPFHFIPPARVKRLLRMNIAAQPYILFGNRLFGYFNRRQGVLKGKTGA
jgi:hypothetical protein